MTDKWILIVDDEATILAVLKSSLRKLGAGFNVATASSGEEALTYLRQRAFDLVITDYRMSGMDGLELLEAVRSLQPGARTILMTAYGNDKVEAQSRRLQAYQYLIKPLEIDDFRQIVKGALKDEPIGRPGILILSDERFKQIVLSLRRLQMEISARCVVLADADGHALARIGDLDHFPLERIVPLLGGCIASLSEAGRALDGAEDTINLIYRETTAENLYVINIGVRLLLIIVVDHSPYNAKLGTVWYVAQQVASMLLLNLVQQDSANTDGLFGDGLEKAVDNALGTMLGTIAAESSTGAPSDLEHPYANPPQGHAEMSRGR